MCNLAIRLIQVECCVICICANLCYYLLPTWLAFSLVGVQTQNYCHLLTRGKKKKKKNTSKTHFQKLSTNHRITYLRLANAGDMQVGPLTSPKTVLFYKLASKAQEGVHANVKSPFRLLLTGSQARSNVKHRQTMH